MSRYNRTKHSTLASRVMGALSDPARLRVVDFLSNNPVEYYRINTLLRSLPKKMNVNYNDFKYHLNCLKKSGLLVYDEISGDKRYKLKDPEKVKLILHALKELSPHKKI